jgi:hypothetical protein
MLATAIRNAKALGKGIKHHDRDMSALMARALVIRAPKKQERGSYSLHVQFHKSYNEDFVHYAKGSHTKVTYTKTSRKIGKEVGRTYIPAAIEFGHMSGGTYVPGLKFMRSAAESTRSESFRRVLNELRRGLLREAIKARHQ